MQCQRFETPMSTIRYADTHSGVSTQWPPFFTRKLPPQTSNVLSPRTEFEYELCITRENTSCLVFFMDPSDPVAIENVRILSALSTGTQKLVIANLMDLRGVATDYHTESGLLLKVFRGRTLRRMLCSQQTSSETLTRFCKNNSHALR